MEEKFYDVVIIGGGPAGGTAALYTSRAELKTLVIDKSVKAGALGMTSKIANWPGIAEITGDGLVNQIQDHAKSYGAEFIQSKVTGTYLNDEEKQIFLAEGELIKAKAVILATGAMGKSKTIPGESELLGKGVSYCATCDGAFFKGKDVAVIGSNEETVHEALFLTRFVRKLYIVTPKSKLEVSEEMMEEVNSKPQIEILYRSQAASVKGESTVTGLELKGEHASVLDVTGVFIFTQGNRPIVDYLIDINMTGEGCLIVNKEMETNIPGVFACGDILCNKVQQAIVAAGQGCVAALSADSYINKRKGVKKDYK